MNDERSRTVPSSLLTLKDDKRQSAQEKTDLDLRRRTKAFALRILSLYASLPRTAEALILGKQLLRSGTSVGAHYREAYRARSPAEFVSKVEGGLQELEEATYWLELLADGGMIPRKRLDGLFREADELTAIFVASVRTAKRRTR